MLPGVTISLQITAIGMGLVFSAIILLWGVISVLMRVTAERKAPINQSEGPITDTYEIIEEKEQKRRAALAAVAVVLALDKQEPHEFPLPPTALVSAWQAVMRASNIRSRGRLK